MNEKKIKLAHPIKTATQLLTELTMRRPKVRDRLAVDKAFTNDGEREINMLANLCSVTPDDIAEMDLADYVTLQREFQDFLTPTPAQSGKAS